MSLAIQSSFEAYVWAALWQISLAGLQVGGPQFNPKPLAEDWISRIQYAICLMGTAVSWLAWGLGIWIAMHVSLTAGIAFTVFSFAMNVITVSELHRQRPNAIMVQALAFFMMPILAIKTLSTLGVLSL